MSAFKLSAIPGDLQWTNDPVKSQVDDQGELLSIATGRMTDWFIDPIDGKAQASAPLALFTPASNNFVLSAKVKVEFASTFDAGALFVYGQLDHWGKLAFEYSPQGQPMIVSVVTRGTSDDCNSVPINGQEVYLRLSRNAATFALHYSTDGSYWHMVRYFTLGVTPEIKVGFLSQSPTGEGCHATFSDIIFKYETLADIRNGK